MNTNLTLEILCMNGKVKSKNVEMSRLYSNHPSRCNSSDVPIRQMQADHLATPLTPTMLAPATILAFQSIHSPVVQSRT